MNIGVQYYIFITFLIFFPFFKLKMPETTHILNVDNHWLFTLNRLRSYIFWDALFKKKPLCQNYCEKLHLYQ